MSTAQTTYTAFTGTGREFVFDPSAYQVTPGAILCNPHGAPSAPQGDQDIDVHGAGRAAAADAWLRHVVKEAQS